MDEPAPRSRLVALVALAAIAVVAVVAVNSVRSDDSRDTAQAIVATDPDGTGTGTGNAPSEQAQTAGTMSDDTAGAATGTAGAATGTAGAAEARPRLSEAPPVLGEIQQLRNLDGWLQSDIDSLDDLAGSVYVVQFWTFGCYNCKNTLPALIDINERYGGEDFTIVGVHTPEFDYEKDPDAILEAADTLGVTWPIALDTDKTNFRAWQEARRFWPRTYVIDRDGQIRFDRIGEGAYDRLEATIAWLLDEAPDDNAESALADRAGR